MVLPLGTAGPNVSTAGRRPLIVELAGPAGAGKTTLALALSQRSNSIRLGNRPRVRSAAYIPFFAKNAALLLPTLLRLYRHGGRLTRHELTRMLRLKGWHRLWEREVRDCAMLIVLDQGPAFTLAQLWGFGSAGLQNQSAKEWWQAMYMQWADILDAVVWLDASDAILVRRISTRPKAHLMVGRTEEEITEFLARYRAAYEQVISKLTAYADGPKLLRFDTAQEGLGEIVDRILSAMTLVQ